MDAGVLEEENRPDAELVPVKEPVPVVEAVGQALEEGLVVEQAEAYKTEGDPLSVSVGLPVEDSDLVEMELGDTDAEAESDLEARESVAEKVEEMVELTDIDNVFPLFREAEVEVEGLWDAVKLTAVEPGDTDNCGVMEAVAVADDDTATVADETGLREVGMEVVGEGESVESGNT